MVFIAPIAVEIFTETHPMVMKEGIIQKTLEEKTLRWAKKNSLKIR